MKSQFDNIDIDPKELTFKKIEKKGCSGCNKLEVFDWLHDIKPDGTKQNLVEVRFKNTRKDFFDNVNNLPLEVGDTIAVEASPGHDIGVVSLTGELVYHQLKKVSFQKPREGFKKIYRIARPTDIEKWEEARALEHQTMIRARQLAKELELNMKIGDVEYQGDKTKAIFYYIADERVDFRQLIKVFAEEFRIRVEMKQIGARQEAARIGGIGSCGRELCCSKFMNKFVSVTTSAARYQALSLNPQKLAGQCGKLKCCLNYELDSYVEAQKDFPDASVILLFNDGRGVHLKTDVYKRTMWYSLERESGNSIVALPVDRVKEIIAFNKIGELVEKLDIPEVTSNVAVEPDYGSVVGQESLTRFDDILNDPETQKRRPKKKGGNRRNPRNNERNNQGSNQGNSQGNNQGKPKQSAGNSKGKAPQSNQGAQVPNNSKGNHNSKGKKPNYPKRPSNKKGGNAQNKGQSTTQE